MTRKAIHGDNGNAPRRQGITELKDQAKNSPARDNDIRLRICPDSTPHRLNLWFSERLRQQSNYTDATLVSELSNGLDIFGEVPITGGLKRKEAMPTLSDGELGRHLYSDNVNVAKHLSNTKDSVTSRSDRGIT